MLLIGFIVIPRAIEVTISRRNRKEIIMVMNVAMILQLIVFAKDRFVRSFILLTPKSVSSLV